MPEESDTKRPVAPVVAIEADRPIAGPGEDLLGRDALARVVATQALAPRKEEGFTLAVTGAWGGGKTSLLRLIEIELGDRAIMVHFNPWLFSGHDELVLRFLAELSNALSPDWSTWKLRSRLRRYAESVVPLPGWAGTALTLAQRALSQNPEEARTAVAKALEKLDKRVVVVIDDVDRLAPNEVADVVRLVKLVGGFPNTTYLLAFDGRQVEEALEQVHGTSGRDYLDKIVQASHPLPFVEPSFLARLLDTELTRRLGEVSPALALGERWGAVRASLLTPLLQTIRDVRRLTNVVLAGLALTGEEVDEVDVVALEALRLFAPDAHARIPAAARALTRLPTGDLGGSQDERDREIVEGFVESMSVELGPDVVRLVFPAAERHVGGSGLDPNFTSEWRRERRVATYPGLLTYLKKTAGEHAIRVALVRETIAALRDLDAFEAVTRDVPDAQLPDLLVRLRDYEDEVALQPPEVTIAVVNLINLLPRLPEERQFFDAHAEFLVRRLCRPWIAGLSESAQAELAQFAMAHIQRFYGRFRFLQWFGDFDDPEAEPPLFDKETSSDLRQELGQALLTASAQELQEERQLRRIIALIRAEGDAGRARLQELSSDHVFLLYLLMACARRDVEVDVEGVEQSRHRLMFDWDAFVDLLGLDVAIARAMDFPAELFAQLEGDERVVAELARDEALQASEA
jgi:hypothetical protein